MRKALLNGPKSQLPRALAISIAKGFMDTARRPAISVLIGELGTIAADIRTTAPIQLIIGETCQVFGTGSQWMISARARDVSTRYACPRFKINMGSRSARRM